MSPRDFAAYAYLSLAWGLSFLLLLHVVDAFGWIGAVTSADVQRAARTYLTAPNRTVIDRVPEAILAARTAAAPAQE